MKRLRDLLKLCLSFGVLPECWKRDRISFIWKRKGSKTDPTRFRPITIANCCGKVLEKLLTTYLGNINPANPWNHAYQKGRGCLTAVVDLQVNLNKLKKLRKRLVEEQDRNLGAEKFDFIFALSADDLEQAFEAVPHDTIAMIIRRSYAGDYRFRAADLATSYLKRSAFALNTRTSETAEITGAVGGRAIPQGSIFSPLAFILFDAGWNFYFLKIMKHIIQDPSNPIVECLKTAYADDHVGVLLIKIKKGANARERAETIMLAFDTVRSATEIATSKMGGGINRSKSENLIPDRFLADFASTVNLGKPEEEKFKVKKSFLWLGYDLELLENGNLLFMEEPIANRLNWVERMRSSFFQYTTSPRIKFQVYKTYLAPFVELYIPLAIQNKEISRTRVHKFQHTSINIAIGAGACTSYEKTNELVDELSVRDKSIRAAQRLVRSIDAADLSFQDHSNPNQEGMTLKSGKSKTSQAVPQDVQSNLIFRLLHYAKLEPSKPLKRNKPKLDYKVLAAKVKANNEEIKKKIAAKASAS